MIDKAVLQDYKKRINLAWAWLNYKKAYDSVPNYRIMVTLEMVGAAENIRMLLRESTKDWRTQLTANSNFEAENMNT